MDHAQPSMTRTSRPLLPQMHSGVFYLDIKVRRAYLLETVSSNLLVESVDKNHHLDETLSTFR